MLSSPITQGYSKTRPHGLCTVPPHLYDHILRCSIKASIVELFGLQFRRVWTNQVSGLKFLPQGTEYNLVPFWKATLNPSLKKLAEKRYSFGAKPASFSTDTVRGVFVTQTVSTEPWSFTGSGEKAARFPSSPLSPGSGRYLLRLCLYVKADACRWCVM